MVTSKQMNFGDYCRIEQKRYVGPNEMYQYKVIGRLFSNCWVDVPVDARVANGRETHHDGMEEVIAAICCGVSEREVLRFRAVDCRPDETSPRIDVLALLKEARPYMQHDRKCWGSTHKDDCYCGFVQIAEKLEAFNEMPSVEPKCQHDLLKPNTTIVVDPDDPFHAACSVCKHDFRTRAPLKAFERICMCSYDPAVCEIHHRPENGSEKQT